MAQLDPAAERRAPTVPPPRGRAEPPGAAPGRSRRPDPRQVFWATFVLFFTLTALWSLASPLMAGLDEPAHAVKAASVVRGELTGEPFAADPAASALVRSQQDGRGLVDVTALFAQLGDLPSCFAFYSDNPASCQPPIVADPDAATEAVTSASQYNPLYYFVVGLPSLFPGSAATIYLMRLISALLSSWLIALAFRTVAELPRSLWPAVAVTVSITPMVLFMNSTINPQAPELAGALAIWVCLSALLRYPDPDLLRPRLARLTVATLFFVNARGLGPLFLVGIVLAVIVSAPLANLVGVLRDRRAWPYLAACAVVSLAAVAWIVIVGSLVSSPSVNFPEYAVGSTILELTLGRTSAYIQQSLGLFGWQDVILPGWTYAAMAAVLLFVIVAGFSVSRWRDRLVIVVVALVTLVTPLVAHYVQARYIGPFWQGRYILPVAFGVPVIAGFALHDRTAEVPAWITRRLVCWGFVAVGALQTMAFAMNLHRYVNGWSGDWFADENGSWNAPLSPVVMVAATAVSWAMLAVVLWAGSDWDEDRAAVDRSSGDGAAAADGRRRGAETPVRPREQRTAVPRPQE